MRTNRLTEKKEQDADPDYPGLLRLSGVVLATPSSQTWSQGAPLHSKPGPTASNCPQILRSSALIVNAET